MNSVQLSDERLKTISRILILGTMIYLGNWLTQQVITHLPETTKYPLVLTILYPFLMATVLLTAFVKGRRQQEILNSMVLFSVWPGLLNLIAGGFFYLMLVLLGLPELGLDLVLYSGLIVLVIYKVIKALIEASVKYLDISSNAFGNRFTSKYYESIVRMKSTFPILVKTQVGCAYKSYSGLFFHLFTF